jgi:hypothetical protein
MWSIVLLLLLLLFLPNFRLTQSEDMSRFDKIIVSFFILLLISIPSKGQVLISLIFGDALNSDNIEFGLDVGINRSKFLDISQAQGVNNLNLGFYFHIKVRESSYISTGVMVKSVVGTAGLDTYFVGNESIDSVFQDGTLTKKINTFYVPILFHQRLFDDRWYIEAGGMPGLRTKGKDIFNIQVQDGDLEYILDVSDEYTRLDFGLMGGVGFKFRKHVKSVSVGVSYYYGLVNISKVPDTIYRNSSLYIYAKIPIGAQPKE